MYDYQGLRIEKTTTDSTVSNTGSTPITTTKKYVNDDQSVLMQTDVNGNTLSKYDYCPNRLLSLNHITEGSQFYLFDALGSPVNLTNPDGTVQARYQYDAFGNYRSTTGTSENIFGYTGHEKDEESGLYYFKARYYDPTLGQVLTNDAFEGISDSRPSLHKYIYAYGNPTLYTDPSGNCVCDLCIVESAITIEAAIAVAASIAYLLETERAKRKKLEKGILVQENLDQKLLSHLTSGTGSLRWYSDNKPKQWNDGDRRRK